MDTEPELNICTDTFEGDLDRLIELHKRTYTMEFGFDGTYEEEMSGQFREFFLRKDPRERLWIVKRDSEVMGSIGVLRHSDDTAVLRWLLLHPDIRGRGIGKVLMASAIEFCREAGYEKAFLWTLDILKPAASIYCSLDFKLVEEEDREKWGHVFKHQRYELMFVS